MEYTFRASSKEMPTTIHLSEFDLTVRQGKQETVIPYAVINDVLLNKNSSKLFKMRVQAEGKSPIVVTNTYYTTEKEVEDRSRAYSTFVRVLHFHLKDKSHANYVVMQPLLKVFQVPKSYSPTDIPLEFLP